MVERRRWTHLAIWVHLLVVIVASWQLASAHAKPVYALWAAISAIEPVCAHGIGP